MGPEKWSRRSEIKITKNEPARTFMLASRVPYCVEPYTAFEPGFTGIADCSPKPVVLASALHVSRLDYRPIPFLKKAELKKMMVEPENLPHKHPPLFLSFQLLDDPLDHQLRRIRQQLHPLFQVFKILKGLFLARFQQERKEMSRFLPATTLRTFSRQGNEGLYGWTHRHNDGIINVREDLQEEKRIETIIHESIHTPDEYETIRLTEWIMESMFLREEKYRTKPEEYAR